MTWGCQAGLETANLITVMKNYKITNTESYESIKLGIDAHAKWYYVARQLDGATPQPVQKMDFEGLQHFVARQKRMAREVHTCYEAGICFFIRDAERPEEPNRARGKGGLTTLVDLTP
jgi:hypothetical protein